MGQTPFIALIVNFPINYKSKKKFQIGGPVSENFRKVAFHTLSLKMI